jgi:predicted ester cyclase
MSVEQVARDFITSMDDPKKSLSMMAPGATISGGVLPSAMPASEAINMMSALKQAFPDLKFDVQQVTVNGDIATIHAKWGGTNSGTLQMPGMPGMPSMPAIPATGKKVSVPDTYMVTVKGDKVSHMEVKSPADGGIPAALGQLGVKMPGM